MEHGLKNKKTLVSLAAYLMFFFAGPQGPVLCMGSDGHMGVKVLSLNSYCCEAPLPSKARTTFSDDTTPLMEDACGPCVDIPAFAHDAGSGRTRIVTYESSNLFLMAAIVTVTLTPELPSANFRTPFSEFFISPRGPDLPALSTVILLI